MVTIEPIEKLSTQIARLQGIGPKTALRLAYQLLDVPETQARELARAIVEMREKVHDCPVCGNYSDVFPCRICADVTRDKSVICVVCDPKDVNAMEKTREYKGQYHVLHGVLSPMDGIGPDDIRINELLERIKTGEVKEVILATNPDVEGEATASYIVNLLRPYRIKCTRIAHGVPIGGNLEYTDEVTLARALQGRRTME